MLRLWSAILLLNLVGGSVMTAVMMVDGALLGGSGAVLTEVAEDIAAKEWSATLARAVLTGALVTLLS